MRNDNEKRVLCIDGCYMESLDDLKKVIKQGQFDIGTVKTNELLAAFRDGAVQEWLSCGTKEEQEIAESFPTEKMRHDVISDTKLLELIISSFVKDVPVTAHNVNVSIQFLSAEFITPSGNVLEISDNTIYCKESCQLKVKAYLKSDRAINDSANIILKCPEKKLEESRDMQLFKANEEPVPVQFELDYTAGNEPITLEFLYNDTKLSSYTVTSVFRENGFEAVELGLSVRWAKINVGAAHPTETGKYYAFGETQDKDSYIAINYVPNFKDVASLEWKGRWRMPTAAEFQELIDKCTWEWTKSEYGEGFLIKGKNGNKIFLSAAGMKDGIEVKGEHSCGQYWTQPNSKNKEMPNRLIFGKFGSNKVDNKCNREYGLTVRPVLPK